MFTVIEWVRATALKGWLKISVLKVADIFLVLDPGIAAGVEVDRRLRLPESETLDQRRSEVVWCVIFQMLPSLFYLCRTGWEIGCKYNAKEPTEELFQICWILPERNHPALWEPGWPVHETRSLWLPLLQQRRRWAGAGRRGRGRRSKVDAIGTEGA